MSSDDDSDGEQRAMRLLMPCEDSDDDNEAFDAAWAAATAGSGGDGMHEAMVGGVMLRIRTQARLGIGFQLWPAAQAAVSYAALEPALWRGRRVLELGSGVGLTGLALAALGAHVTLSDLPEVADGVLGDNVAANADAVARVGGTAGVVALCWGDERHTDRLRTPGQLPYDVLLLADCVYRRELFSPLVCTLRALASPHTLLVIAHLKRWKSESAFWRLLERHFTPREEAFVQASPVAGQRRPVRVFTCRLRNAADSGATCSQP